MLLEHTKRRNSQFVFISSYLHRDLFSQKTTHTKPSTYVHKQKQHRLPLIYLVKGIQWFFSSLSASSSLLPLAFPAVSVGVLYLLSSILPSLSHVSILGCASLVRRLFCSSIVQLFQYSLPVYFLVSTVLCLHVLSVVFSIFTALQLYTLTHHICMGYCIRCSSSKNGKHDRNG